MLGVCSGTRTLRQRWVHVREAVAVLFWVMLIGAHLTLLGTVVLCLAIGRARHRDRKQTVLAEVDGDPPVGPEQHRQAA